MCTYFNIKTDVARNLIDDFFSIFDCQRTFTLGRVLSEKKKYGGTGLISEKSEVLCEELNERAEAATGSYCVRGDSFQYIDSVPVTKNHRNIWLK